MTNEMSWDDLRKEAMDLRDDDSRNMVLGLIDQAEKRSIRQKERMARLRALSSDIDRQIADIEKMTANLSN